MYISRVEIDRDNRRKVRDLTHVGAYHAWVEESFPSELEQSIRTRKLWRIDRIQGKDYLIIVSVNYISFYLDYDSEVYIDRILYARRDYMRILFGDIIHDEY